MLRRTHGLVFVVALLLALIDRTPSPVILAAPRAPVFEDIAANLIGVRDSAVAWGDFDGDDDPDPLVAGFTGTGRLTAVYRNNRDGTFTDIGAGLIGVSNGAVAWGDYNNDGRLDIALSGNTGSGLVTRLYRNDTVTDTIAFTLIATTLVGVDFGAVVWGDYDNDGRSDLCVTGESAAGAVSKLYHNLGGGNFVDSGLSFVGVSHSSAAWSDYNSDGYLDLLVSGQTASGTSVTQLYQNHGGLSFSVVTTGLPALHDGSAAWGDYDNDGDPDLLLAGFEVFTPTAKIYRNDNGAFVDIHAALVATNAQWTRAAWGDYDSDGSLDVLLASYPDTRVYHNDGNGEFRDIYAGLALAQNGALAWGDYDADRRLDILLSGQNSGGVYTRIYRNQLTTANTPPAAPAGLVALTGPHTARLMWAAATDVQTPADGLTYNLRVGTTISGSQIVSPWSNAATGYHQVPMTGNRDHVRSMLLTDLSPGEYFWGVQAIDSGFTASVFAEGTFRVWAHYTYLPVVLKNYITLFESPTEIEPNNTPEQANGALISGRAYTGHHNDDKDYFSFYAETPGALTAQLTTAYRDHVQLQFRMPTPTGGSNVLTYAWQQPFTLTYAITQTGWYYALIFTEPGFEDNSVYTLTVTYP
jgi:hypothetical protein